MKRIIYAIIHIIAAPLLKLLFGFKVNGRGNIPSAGGVIIAANHLSYLDPPVLGAGVPRLAHYMARDDLFSFPIWGNFLRFLNAFPVHREGVDMAAIKRAINHLQRGGALILFPEGTRSLTGELLPPQPGAGMIAWEGRAAVVPAYIRGTDKALPPKAKFIRFKKVEVTFGRPFSPGRLFSSSAPRKEIYLKISQHIMSEIALLKNKGKKS